MGANEAMQAAVNAAPSPAPPGRRWFLEGVAADGSHTVHEVAVLPFRVGRDPGNELALQAPGMSRQHAVLTATEDGRLLLTDLGSTNGSYVNRVRLAAARVLEEPSYREAAEAIAASPWAHGGARRAASEVEVLARR